MIDLPVNSKINRQASLHQLAMSILGFEIDGNDGVEEKEGMEEILYYTDSINRVSSEDSPKAFSGFIYYWRCLLWVQSRRRRKSSSN